MRRAADCFAFVLPASIRRLIFDHTNSWDVNGYPNLLISSVVNCKKLAKTRGSRPSFALASSRCCRWRFHISMPVGDTRSMPRRQMVATEHTLLSQTNGSCSPDHDPN